MSTFSKGFRVFYTNDSCMALVYLVIYIRGITAWSSDGIIAS